VSFTDFPDPSIVIDVYIKDTNAPLIIFQTDKAEYATYKNIDYQITVVDENNHPI